MTQLPDPSDEPTDTSIRSTKSGPIVGVFADDLTGALDAAAPFAARGFVTLVSPLHELPHGASNAEVVSVNLGTRHMESNEIVNRASAAIDAMVGLGVRVFFNKVDSTLRGNPGVELAAAISALAIDHAVICSAFPQNGRTIADGVMLVGGVPVADTDVGQDQLSPLVSSNVEGILSRSLERAGLGEQVEIRTGSSGGNRAGDRPLIVAPDAESENDLLMLASRILIAPSPALVAGSGGLAGAIAAVLEEGRHEWESEPADHDDDDVSGLESRTGAGGILIVTASQRVMVDEQVAALGLGDQFDLAVAEVSVGDTLDGIDAGSVDQLSRAIADGGVAVLKLGKLGMGGDHIDSGELQAMAQTLVRNLGQAVRSVTDEAQPDALIVIGGDTASGVLHACGVGSIRLHDELQPGTVSGRPVDGSIAGSLLVTRAGGFGDKKSLLELVSLLRT